MTGPRYTAAFLAAVNVTLVQEGGYTSSPDDPGNWTGGAVNSGECKGTNFGVSAKAYPSVDIKALTRDDAIAIYFRDYWTPVQGDALPFPVALTLFDIRVNGGAGVKWLQQALTLTADGVIGPATIAAANASPDPLALAARVMRRRVLYWASLGTFPTFGTSWVQRAFDIYRVACTTTL